MLVVADVEVPHESLADLFEGYGMPGEMTWFSKTPAPEGLYVEIKEAESISGLADATFDDVLYFGSDAETIESLFAKVALNGLLNIVQCGGKFGRDIVTMVGRVHYGGIRIIGTTGAEPVESMKIIPENDEIRPGDKINIIGAGGPMGMMHVIRNICQGIEGVSVFASDVDDNRLATLTRIAEPLAQKNNVAYKTFNPTKEKLEEEFDYSALMAPIPALVAASVHSSAKGGLINIFAGIPATVTGEIDLDTYIEKGLYFIGTSGSSLEDMKLMLGKAESGSLDTNVSVAAVCGLDGATEGIRAVESRSIAGKIIVYPSCKGLELVRLDELNEKIPDVGKCLNDGLWTKEAEDKLLEMYQS